MEVSGNFRRFRKFRVSWGDFGEGMEVSKLSVSKLSVSFGKVVQLSACFGKVVPEKNRNLRADVCAFEG